MEAHPLDKYYFDGTTFYIRPKLPADMDQAGANAPSTRFERGGAWVYDVINTWIITVVAHCSTDWKGFCSAKPSDVIPPWHKPCPSSPTPPASTPRPPASTPRPPAPTPR
eukprot:Sspe_Gene.6534::Locus_2201_Transcript_1_1_Confidence_1.000_Length_2989::g.6534::m.6534